jgi:broad-specificity NMP kinase
VCSVLLTGPPGAGKTVALTALSDALVADRVEHAAVDVDEVAWGYPFPTLEQRCECLRACCEAHRRMGHRTLLVAEVIESAGHLRDVRDAVGANDLLLVRLEARLATLRERIVAREPPGWPGLEYLLGETEPLHTALPQLDGVHLVLDTEQLEPAEIAERVRSARPDKL